MSETTFEQAKRCPKCQKPGNDKIQRPAPNLPQGTLIHTIYCEQEGCEWKDTCWMVQTNPDGSVPPPRDHRGEPKMYVGFESHEQEARDILRALHQDKLKQQQLGYEIKRRGL